MLGVVSAGYKACPNVTTTMSSLFVCPFGAVSFWKQHVPTIDEGLFFSFFSEMVVPSGKC